MTLETLMQMIDDYAEQRHKSGDWTYNPGTSLKRKELEVVLEDLIDDAQEFHLLSAMVYEQDEHEK